MNPDIHELPPPADPTVFESLCLDLWKDICQETGAQKNGRRGQNQDGVDIFGKSSGKWIGIQCKQKDGLLRFNIKPKELEDEAKDARNFKPALGKFILATTGARDGKVQERARQLTDENQSEKLFVVEVWSWREIWQEFCGRPELFNRVGPQYWPYVLQKKLSSLHQLLPLPTLLGREEQLAELEKQLTTSNKWLGLQGMGGVGKTALATALAHRLKFHCPDAQLHFDLRGTDIHNRSSAKPIEAMQHVIRSIHPEASFRENFDELAALYRSVLGDAGRVLLVFDNVADEAQIHSLLPPPNCLLIVTSRNRFTAPGFAMQNVDCLKPVKSQELLVKLALRIKGYESEAAELCGHLPLALLVVAGIFNQHSIIEPSRLLDDLRNRRKTLDAVDAAFQVSYELLSQELRLRWCLLSVFPASFDIWAATAIWGKVSPDNKVGISVQAALRAETEPDLQALVNASLIEWNENVQRFCLHNLVRQFCDAKLSTQERIQLHCCHSHCFCDVVREANKFYSSGGENSVRGLAMFDDELSNIIYGYRWAFDSFCNVNFQMNEKQIKQAVAFACSAYPVVGAELFQLRLNPEARIPLYEVGLQAAREIGDVAAEGSHLGNLGVAYAQSGQAQKAISLFKQRFFIAQQLQDYNAECSALGNLTGAHSMLGENEIAQRYCEDEIKIRRKLGDRRGEGNALCSLGIINANLKQFEKAIELYNQQIKIARDGGFLHDETVALSNLGNAYREIGQTENAIESLDRAIALCRQLRDIKTEGNCLTNLGNVFVVRGELRTAIEIYQQSIKCKQAAGDIRGVASTLQKLSRAYHQLGDHSQSLKCAETALEIYEQIRDPAAAKAREIVARVREFKKVKSS